ncbi:hypothetical protein ACRAWD_28270 [Caulobacter segnis]
MREQLADTKPFVVALFERERDLEPLDTPERKAGLRQRLRAAAGTIADKDLAQAYKDDLRDRYDALFHARATTPQDGGGYGGSRRGAGASAKAAAGRSRRATAGPGAMASASRRIRA